MDPAELAQEPPSYKWRSRQQRELAERVVGELVQIGRDLSASTCDLEHGSPRPVVELRGTPRV